MTKFIASTQVHKVYKYKKTYLAKVICATSSGISSITSDNAFDTKELALEYAKGMLEIITADKKSEKLAESVILSNGVKA